MKALLLVADLVIPKKDSFPMSKTLDVRTKL